MSGLLSVDGKKILHMDRNDYYGAAGAGLLTRILHTPLPHPCAPNPSVTLPPPPRPSGASLNLTDFCQKFGGAAPPPALGGPREYNIDLIPKYAPSRPCPCPCPLATAALSSSSSLVICRHSRRHLSLTLAFALCRYIMADGNLIKMLVKADVNKSPPLNTCNAHFNTPNP